MKKVSFVSEPVQHHGGAVADVMVGSIASSTYSQAETFLRETLQNACDQKVEPGSQIDFIVDAFQVTGKRKVAYDDFLAEGRLGGDPLGLGKLKELKSFEALVVADVGTNGLKGPLDASIDETPSNFAGFFFNIGRQNLESNSGGAFGLGRTVLTNASDYSTIIVYSQFLDSKGRRGSRLMGMAIRGAFTYNSRKFTGRHWFGQPPKDDLGLVRPFENNDAEKLAQELDLKKYLGDRTGFVAIVIGNTLIENPDKPVLSQNQRQEAIDAIHEAACIYGWPHMLGSKKQRSVNFHFYCDGKERAEKNPAQMPVLSNFVKCYEALQQQTIGVENTEIFFSPQQGKREPTGNLTWLSTPSNTQDLEFAKRGLIPLSAVALMRQANFVVKYLEVTQKADQVVTRGVFKSNERYDRDFRKSEPVAHDDWIPTKLQLKPHARNPIKQTLENIRENFKKLAGLRPTEEGGSPSVVLGNVVGRLLDGLALTGPLKPNSGKTTGAGAGGSGGSGKSGQVVPIGTPRIVNSTKEFYEAIFKFQIIMPKNLEIQSSVEFETFPILENGLPEKDPPSGLNVPKIKNISLESKVLKVNEPLALNGQMHLKSIEVTVQCPQGMGSTCNVKA